MNSISKSRLWTARIMSGLVILFMLFDSIFKFIQPAPVVEGTLQLGYAQHHLAVIGTLGLISTILYAIPRTAFLGAVLLTGYFGGGHRYTHSHGCSSFQPCPVSGLSCGVGLGSDLAEKRKGTETHSPAKQRGLRRINTLPYTG